MGVDLGVLGGSFGVPEGRFWGHECRRVFSDRLINDEDRAAFQALLEQQVEAQFGLRWAEVSPAPSRVTCPPPPEIPRQCAFGSSR